MYNIVPWFTAIPSGIGGGCLSDHLINQGIKQESSLLCCSGFSFLIETEILIQILKSPVSFSAGYRVSHVRKLMQVSVGKKKSVYNFVNVMKGVSVCGVKVCPDSLCSLSRFEFLCVFQTCEYKP